MMKLSCKIFLLVALIFSLFLLCGCWDKNEPEELAIVVAGGYDYNPENDMYKIILQVENPMITAAASGESGSGDKPAFWNISAWGHTPVDAIANIRKQISRKIYYSHLHLLIISDKLASTRGVITVMDTLARSRQSRPLLYIAVTSSDVEDILSVEFPIELTNAQGLLNMINITNTELGTAIIQEGRQFLNKLSQPGIEPVAIYLEYTGDLEGEELKPDSPPQVKMAGLVAFSDNKMCGILNDRETRGYSWFRDQENQAIININYPEDIENTPPQVKTHLTLFTIRESYKITPYFKKNGEPAIRAEFKVSGNIISATGEVDFKEMSPLFQSMENQFAEVVRNDINMALQKAQSLKSDIFGFGNAFYRQHYQKWLEMKEDWPELFAQLPMEVDVRATIKRTGLINRGIKNR